MVGGEDEDGSTPSARHQWVPDQAELDREILKPAERAERLRLAVNSGTKLRLERSIDRFDLQIIQFSGRRFGLHWLCSIRCRTKRARAAPARRFGLRTNAMVMTRRQRDFGVERPGAADQTEALPTERL